ncbi:TetR/AcrR family transcriptional regulator [Streptomyces sp. GMR22]|uniref:TetR/AcrR family transcriptional regulator n=1 Tax=Streptomyces sp. GMR22 TaxID=2759524 RepID=UPI0015F7B020|nr:TetR/AcrR family transcriptional regulator [Streptomyces sp. GMR22]MBA6441751.1 TetR/AcrR family transcriptional regulator [Streptomyces sp. GMR22]
MVNWEKVAQPAKAARAALSYEVIATAAIEVADAQGLDAVTMRKVAEHIGAGAMSLYRYVDSRDDLITLMVDRVSAEATAPPPTGDWRADLTAAAHRIRQVTLRHPWLARHALNAEDFGPGTLAMTESTLALLDGHGLDSGEMLDAWRTLLAFVQGHAFAEARRHEARQRRADESETGAPGPSFLDKAAESGEYPLSTRALREAPRPTDPRDAFDRRLGHVLDGLAQAFFERGRR